LIRGIRLHQLSWKDHTFRDCL